MKKGLIWMTFLFLVVAGSISAQEVAWVMGVNKNKDLAEIQIVDIKTNLLISFQDIEKLNLSRNGVVGFDFVCATNEEGYCDLSRHFRIRINGETGDVIAWQFLRPLEEVNVYRGKKWSALTSIKIQGLHLLLALNHDDPQAYDLATKKGENFDKFELSESNPYVAYINNMPFNIVGVELSRK